MLPFSSCLWHMRCLSSRYIKPTQVPEALRQFLGDMDILIHRAAIHNDARMLKYYGLDIASTYDLQQEIPNPTENQLLLLYDLANTYIGTTLDKKSPKTEIPWLHG